MNKSHALRSLLLTIVFASVVRCGTEAPGEVEADVQQAAIGLPTFVGAGASCFQVTTQRCTKVCDVMGGETGCTPCDHPDLGNYCSVCETKTETKCVGYPVVKFGD